MKTHEDAVKANTMNDTKHNAFEQSYTRLLKYLSEDIDREGNIGMPAYSFRHILENFFDEGYCRAHREMKPKPPEVAAEDAELRAREHKNLMERMEIHREKMFGHLRSRRASKEARDESA